MAATEDQLKEVLSSLNELSSRKASDTVDNLALLTASTPLLSSLKRLNRQIHLDLVLQKERVGEERSKVDTARLELQNLKYEESMLEQEVRVCQEFQSIYQDIQLHDLEEFRQLAPHTPQEMSLDDEHEFMLNRLRFELEERKRLEQEKQRLQQEKTEVAKDNKLKKEKLEQAEKQLKDLVHAAHAVQAKFESF